jgi:hypothetical protein
LAQVFEPEAPTAIPPRAAAPALSSLEKSFEALDTLQVRAAYAQSAAAVRALIDQAGPAALLNLLTFVGEGTPFEQAFERAVFVSYSDFQKQMTDAARLVP